MTAEPWLATRYASNTRRDTGDRWGTITKIIKSLIPTPEFLVPASPILAISIEFERTSLDMTSICSLSIRSRVRLIHFTPLGAREGPQKTSLIPLQLPVRIAGYRLAKYASRTSSLSRQGLSLRLKSRSYPSHLDIAHLVNARGETGGGGEVCVSGNFLVLQILIMFR